MSKSHAGRPPKNPNYPLCKIFLERGIDRATFAQAVGVSRSHLDMILRGEKRPGSTLALKMSKLLGVPLEDILFPKVKEQKEESPRRPPGPSARGHRSSRKEHHPMPEETSLISAERIEKAILLIRGHKVMLDADLAALYEVEVRVLVQAVKRNLARFLPDFMFQLTPEEWRALRSQFVTLERGRGKHRKYLPYAFTEQGVAMLSSVLNSPRAVQVNIAIMRAFVRLRQMLATHEELPRKIAEQESKYDAQFRVVFDAIHYPLTPPDPGPERRIGFRSEA